MAQAFFVFILGFYPNQQNEAANATGKAFTFWPGGQNVFWICIFLVNFTLLKMQHNWTGWLELTIFVCTFSYFLIVWWESLLPAFPDVYKFMQESVSSGSAWLGAFFIFASLVTIDTMCKAVWSDFLWPLIRKQKPEGVFPVLLGISSGVDDYL